MKIQMEDFNAGKFLINTEFPEYISRSELYKLQKCAIDHIISPRQENNTLVYDIDNCVPVLKYMETAENPISYDILLLQAIQVCQDIKQMGLAVKKVCFNVHYTFIGKKDGQLKFMYFPVNGMNYSFDFMLFLQDIEFQSREFHDQKSIFLENALQTSNSGKAKYFNGEKRPMEKPEEDLAVSAEDEKTISRWKEEELTVSEEGAEDLTVSEDDAEDDRTVNMDGGENECTVAMDNEEDDRTVSMEDEEDDDQFLNIPSVNRQKEKSVEEKRILIHLRTGYQTRLIKTPFNIGRSPIRADYRIGDNPKIGNVHAIITKEQGVFYLQDANSKNGTFVGGRRLIPGERVSLYTGMTFRIFNETFQFQ